MSLNSRHVWTPLNGIAPHVCQTLSMEYRFKQQRDSPVHTTKSCIKSLDFLSQIAPPTSAAQTEFLTQVDAAFSDTVAPMTTPAPVWNHACQNFNALSAAQIQCNQWYTDDVANYRSYTPASLDDTCPCSVFQACGILDMCYGCQEEPMHVSSGN